MTDYTYQKSSPRTKKGRAEWGRVNWNQTSSGSSASVLHSLEDYLNGYKNPRWREAVRNNNQAATEMVAQLERLNVKRHSAEEYWNWWVTPKPSQPLYQWYEGDYILHNLTPSSSAGSSLETKANNQALTAFISDADSKRQVLQSGELIGEYAELVRQVKRPGESLTRGLKSYVNSVRNRVTRAPVRRLPYHRRQDVQAKIISDTWLEYKFGWQPLINEIDGVIDYYNEEDISSRYDVVQVQGVGREQGAAWNSSSHVQFTAYGPGARARIRTFSEVLVVYRGQLDMASSAAGYTAEKVGFAPSQWLPTAWELVPYSFLLDYFANIGDMIYAISFPRSQLRWITKTVVANDEVRYVDTIPTWLNGTVIGNPYYPSGTIDRRLYSLGGASRTLKRVERGPYSGSLVPTLEFSIPNTATKWLNMAALFAGARYVQKLLK